MTIDVMSMLILNIKWKIQFSPRICFSMAENETVSKIADKAI